MWERLSSLGRFPRQLIFLACVGDHPAGRASLTPLSTTTSRRSLSTLWKVSAAAASQARSHPIGSFLNFTAHTAFLSKLFPGKKVYLRFDTGRQALQGPRQFTHYRYAPTASANAEKIVESNRAGGSAEEGTWKPTSLNTLPTLSPVLS